VSKNHFISPPGTDRQQITKESALAMIPVAGQPGDDHRDQGNRDRHDRTGQRIE
jgi:hypothetical protein